MPTFSKCLHRPWRTFFVKPSFSKCSHCPWRTDLPSLSSSAAKINGEHALAARHPLQERNTIINGYSLPLDHRSPGPPLWPDYRRHMGTQLVVVKKLRENEPTGPTNRFSARIHSWRTDNCNHAITITSHT